MRFRHLLASTGAIHTVISTHIVEDVTAVAPVVSVLSQGQKVYQGSPEGLCHHAEGLVFVGAPARGVVMAHTPQGQRILTREQVSGHQPVPPTIEEGYLALVGVGK